MIVTARTLLAAAAALAAACALPAAASAGLRGGGRARASRCPAT